MKILADSCEIVSFDEDIKESRNMASFGGEIARNVAKFVTKKGSEEKCVYKGRRFIIIIVIIF